MYNEKVYFEKINGKHIFCNFSVPKNEQKKIVIINHGFRGSSTGSTRGYVNFQRLLNKEGYSVLRFDQPNCGNSEGDYIDSSFDEWVNTTTYFAEKYLDYGYRVSLLGNSMGGTAAVVATSRTELKDKIPCILLWVPGVNEGDFNGDSEEVFEEAGQKYKGKFWLEARNANFFKCLNQYEGGIHLVYGERDKYMSQEIVNKVVDLVKSKNQSIMILKGQNHSSWDYDIAQKVYKKELIFLKKYL